MVKLIKNMRIRGKLFLGFLLLLVITTFIALFGASQISSVSSDYSHAINFILDRRGILRDMEVAMMDARRTMNRASMHASDVYGDGSNEAANAEFRNIGITNQENLIRSLRVDLEGYIAAFRASVDNDYRISEEMRAIQNARMDGLEEAIFYYIDHYILTLIMRAARAGDTATAVAVTTAAGGQGGTVPIILGYFDQIRGGINETLDRTMRELEETSSSTFIIMIVLAVVGLVLGTATAIIISSIISKPIIEIAGVVKSVAAGNFNINFRSDVTKDEVGGLTNDVYGLVNVVKDIVADLTTLNHEYNTVGDIDYRIDSTKYQNTFKEVVEGVNNIPEQIVKDVLLLIDGLAEINKGNFDLHIPDLPGKKIVLSKSVRTTTEKLRSVSNEVNAMIEAAVVKGDLDFKIDTDRYEGDWQKIMVGLNDIARAVDEPLEVVVLALEEMKRGNFDLQDIDAGIAEKGFDVNVESYKGVFKGIIVSINDTIEEIHDYIEEITRNLAMIAKGDLTTQISRNFLGDFDPIKGSINNISVTLRKTMTEISTASEQVLTGAKQIASSAQDLASGAGEQANSVQELNIAIDAINTQTRQNAESASMANELSAKSTTSAKEGNESMQEMLTAMTHIKTSSSDISKIIKVIEGIAFQTNLLALNAAVEAARAGEHGKGFSVVAEEVRSLAGRSQESATDTTGLIETSISQVDNGSTIAETTAISLDEIVKNASEVSELISSIAAASKEQAEAIAQVSSGLVQISKVTQNNSAVSEETAAASQELNSQAETLKELVTFFKV